MIRILVQSFSWGILLAITTMVIELLLALVAGSFGYDAFDISAQSAFYFIAVFVFVEEIAKYLLIAKGIEPISYARDAMINAYSAGFGFALVEVILLWYRFNNITEWEEIIKVVGLHLLTFGYIGYRIIIKKPKQIDFFVITLTFLLHFLFNFSVLYFTDTNIKDIAQLSIIAFLAMINLFSFMFVNKKLASQ
jgi:hypothetical protein